MKDQSATLISVISLLMTLALQLGVEAQAPSEMGEVQIFQRGVILPIERGENISNALLRESNAALSEMSECIIKFAVIPADEVNEAFKAAGKPICRNASCLQTVLDVTQANFVFLPKIEVRGGQITKFGGWVLHDTGQKVKVGEDVSAFAKPYPAVAVGLSHALRIPFGEGMYCNDLAELNRTVQEIKEQGPSVVPGADLSNVETETQYPIIGPAILGAAGIAFTSVAIASLASEKCRKTEENGTCIDRKTASHGAIFGFGAVGVGALAAGVTWFLLGAEEVPVDVQVDEQTAAIQFKGQF